MTTDAMKCVRCGGAFHSAEQLWWHFDSGPYHFGCSQYAAAPTASRSPASAPTCGILDARGGWQEVVDNLRSEANHLDEVLAAKSAGDIRAAADFIEAFASRDWPAHIALLRRLATHESQKVAYGSYAESLMLIELANFLDAAHGSAARDEAWQWGPPFKAKTVEEWWDHVTTREIPAWIAGKFTASHIVVTIKELVELERAARGPDEWTIHEEKGVNGYASVVDSKGHFVANDLVRRDAESVVAAHNRTQRSGRVPSDTPHVCGKQGFQRGGADSLNDTCPACEAANG